MSVSLQKKQVTGRTGENQKIATQGIEQKACQVPAAELCILPQGDAAFTQRLYAPELCGREYFRTETVRH
jgi:hypothetical protein